MTLNYRKAALLIAVTFLLAAGIVWLRSYIFSSVVAGIHEKIDSLKLSGLVITYDSLSFNWRKNVIEIENLLVEKNAFDTTCVYPEFIKIENVRAEGFRFLSLIFRNILSFENVYLENPHLIIRPNSIFNFDPTSQKQNELRLRADHILIHAAHLEYADNSTCKIVVGLKSNLIVEELKVDFDMKRPLMYAAASFTFDSVQMRLSEKPYTYEITHAVVDRVNEKLTVDSIRIIPDLNKIQFGRAFGYEVDRFEGIIPFIRAEQFSLRLIDSAKVTASVAEVQFYLKIFRDKRLPFRKEQIFLPAIQLNRLPFKLVIDSLKVIKSFVQYEEFQNKAQEPGRIFFDNLEATLTNINNRSHEGEMKLYAQAMLMGEGRVKATVAFPLNPKKRSRLTGSLSNFSIPKINSMLTPTTSVKAESGNMEKLSFHFSFSATKSEGEIELNYQDLKLSIFKAESKNKDGRMEKDNLRTFIINTFIVRKNMDEDVPEQKRKGTINYTRDDSRSIFNFWVKSIFSGVKSAYNLDKTAEKETKRTLKKEERLTRRLARKLKKSAKSKEKG